jgi:5'-nucleotidase
MFQPPLDLAKARILLSNDDGVGAEGLKCLERAARLISPDIWIVAPEHEQSGAGHSLTLQRPLRIRRLDAQRFAVDGTPTDCVLLAVRQIMRGHPPDLILSGVNQGANMGEDVTYSGTVAAAMEGTLLGIPSIAFSLALRWGTDAQWQTAEQVIGDIVPRLVAIAWPDNTLMNVNIPNRPAAELTGTRAGAQGMRPGADNTVEAADPRGRPIYWVGPNRNEHVPEPGTDLAIVASGGVAVTPIHLDLTHRDGLAALHKVFP